MKKMFLFFSSISVLFSSCSNENDKKELLNKDSASIIVGYSMEDDLSDFKPVEKSIFLAFFHEVYAEHLDGETLVDYEINEVYEEGETKPKHLIVFTSSSGNIKIGTPIDQITNPDPDITNNTFAFKNNSNTVRECHCKSISCSSIGCTPSIVSDECSCSWCDGDCEKTAILKQGFNYASMMSAAGL